MQINVVCLLKDFLIHECGFKPHCVSASTMRGRITVYLSSVKLYFVITGLWVGCVLINGHVLRTIFPRINLEDPESLNIIRDKVQTEVLRWEKRVWA